MYRNFHLKILFSHKGTCLRATHRQAKSTKKMIKKRKISPTSVVFVTPRSIYISLCKCIQRQDYSEIQTFEEFFTSRQFRTN
ncbi:hypothetical protein KsCSTR_40540 [Candidatus Kuenenia stuttgartiensis]|uniref:Uncharacterized protein n=1 Tax=Kuenenia stuttgartiensis TaxID=174633 RepID=Q1Q7M1_KUEST|nr:hypothetical protein KsCSTR_40540 [Candidatus Kuenenia stuttgartiensis]CAJ70817.1 unknown protein [Candidatus Kuenenia stuttgartiensis]